MTSKRRKYGDLSARPIPTENGALLDDVFAAFTGKRPVNDEQPAAATPPAPLEPAATQESPTPKPAPAPERDFARVANSVNRDALPAGLFGGTSKQLYDALYQRTRGAMKPTRTIQATRRELIAWSGIKNIKTINTHLKRLRRAGLISHTKLVGEHGGSVYEVFLPEEADPDQTQTRPRPGPDQKLGLDQAQKLVWVGSGNRIENKGTYESPKTVLNTSTDDDEAFAGFCAKFHQASRELTGREPSVSEQEKWSELADLLVAELQIAAARTGSVSSVPAFLTEHLRRRLWKKDKAQLERESREAVTDLATPIDAGKCPDCGGSGWYYPDGPDKGVARCHHTQLHAPD